MQYSFNNFRKIPKLTQFIPGIYNNFYYKILGYFLGVTKAPQDTCYRCGMEGHWSRICRTAKHLVDLYQASLKENGKKI